MGCFHTGYHSEKMERPACTNLWKTCDGARRIEGDILLFYSKNSPLSNHYLAQFIEERQTYNCMEQYLMFQKAMFFNDIITATKIMNTDSPHAQKALGLKVQNFDVTTWRAAVPDLLSAGLKAKFSRVRGCKDYLLLTKGLTLAEASRTDNFYGIGFSLYAREKTVSNQANWGNNLLGKCLMVVRDYLEGDVPDEVDDYFVEVQWALSCQIETPYNCLTEKEFSIIRGCELCGEEEPYCATHSYLDVYFQQEKYREQLAENEQYSDIITLAQLKARSKAQKLKDLESYDFD